MKRIGTLMILVAFGLVSAGCGGSVKEEVIEVKISNDPLSEPRSILKRYAEGQALGSEVANFPHLVELVKKVDPARAEILEKGFADIQKASPTARRGLAKELQEKLAPAMK